MGVLLHGIPRSSFGKLPGTALMIFKVVVGLGVERIRQSSTLVQYSTQLLRGHYRRDIDYFTT